VRDAERRDVLAQHVRKLHRLRRIGSRQKDGELFAAIPGHKIADALHRIAQLVRDPAQAVIAEPAAS
jgi:hypothetical protein